MKYFLRNDSHAPCETIPLSGFTGGKGVYISSNSHFKYFHTIKY